MAVNHLEYNRQTPHGEALRTALASFAAGLQGLKDLHAAMLLMQDGGASTSYIVGKFGFPSTTVADAAVAELGSALAKLTTDAQVTNVQAAINQLLAKFR